MDFTEKAKKLLSEVNGPEGHKTKAYSGVVDDKEFMAEYAKLRELTKQEMIKTNEVKVANIKIINKFDEAFTDDPFAAQEIIKPVFGHIGEGVFIEHNPRIYMGSNIYIGNNTRVNVGCLLYDLDPIIIGNNCLISEGVKIMTFGHATCVDERNAVMGKKGSVVIGDNCVLYAGCIVNPNVKIGRDTVVLPGSVVIRDLPEGVLAAGNPCKVIREISSKDTCVPELYRNCLDTYGEDVFDEACIDRTYWENYIDGLK